MDHAAVGPGLPGADRRRRFEHRERAVGRPPAQLAGHREAEDAAADDDEVGDRGASSINRLAWDAVAEQLEVRVDHQADHLLEARTGPPAKLLTSLRRVPDQVLDLGRAQEGTDHVRAGIEAYVLEGHHQPADAVGLARRDDVVVRLVLLEHQPHGLHVVLRVAPVALGIEIPQGELGGESELDGGGAVGDLAGDELEPRTLAFMVKKYP